MTQVILYPTITRFPMERANSIQVVNTCHALAEKGCRVELFVLKSSAQSTAECLKFYGLHPVENFRIVRMPFMKSGSSIVWNMSAYAACLASLHYSLSAKHDLVVITRDLFIARMLLPRLRSKKFKLFYECHHVEYLFREEMPRLYEGIKPLPEHKIKRIREREEKVYKNVSGIITITRHLRKMLEEKFGAIASVEVIPDGGISVGTSGYGALRKDANGEKKIKNLLYVGDLSPAKGVDVLLRALKNVPDVHLTLAGGLSYEKNLNHATSLSKALEISSRVSFKEYVPPAEVHELYKEADILLLPLSPSLQNSYFTSPLKLFEYMSTGKPIIAARLPAIEEILTDKVTALLVTPDDADEWVKGIKVLLSDKVLAQAMAQNALNLSKEFTWEKRAEKIRMFIQSAGSS